MRGEDRWELWETPYVSHAPGVSSHFMNDPPEEMPESRPLLGFGTKTEGGTPT